MSRYVIAGAMLVLTRGLSAQTTPPFFGGGGVVAYSPTISTVNAGAVFDATAVVSNDRKYVTIGAQATDSRLIALRDFAIASAQLGFVGGANPGGGAGNGGGFAAPADGSTPSPDQIQRAGIAARSVLNRRGMFLLTG